MTLTQSLNIYIEKNHQTLKISNLILKIPGITQKILICYLSEILGNGAYLFLEPA